MLPITLGFNILAIGRYLTYLPFTPKGTCFPVEHMMVLAHYVGYWVPRYLACKVPVLKIEGV